MVGVMHEQLQPLCLAPDGSHSPGGLHPRRIQDDITAVPDANRDGFLIQHKGTPLPCPSQGNHQQIRRRVTDFHGCATDRGRQGTRSQEASNGGVDFFINPRQLRQLAQAGSRIGCQFDKSPCYF